MRYSTGDDHMIGDAQFVGKPRELVVVHLADHEHTDQVGEVTRGWLASSGKPFDIRHPRSSTCTERLFGPGTSQTS